MGTIFLSIIIGGFVRAVGPASGRPGSQGAAKLAGYGFMGIGIFLVLGNAFRSVGGGN